MRKRWLTDSICFITGSALYALSVSVFWTPADVAPGGATGLGVFAHALWGWPVGMVVMLVNLPLLLAAFFKLSKGYALRTAGVLLLSSVLMDLSAPLVVPFTGDRLLAALCGGLLSGGGIGLIMTRGASTGGSEIAASLWQKRKPHWSVGRLLLLIDAAVIALSVPVFGGLSAALYAAIGVFVSSTVIDRIVYGREEGRLLLVITSAPQAVCDAIHSSMSRGVTVVDAVGGYSKQAKSLLLCAVSRIELPELKRLVLSVDARAFAMIVPTKQVVGEGFLRSAD